MAQKTPHPEPAPQGASEGPAETSLRRIPLVPLRDDVVFPKLIVPLSVGRRTSIAAITAAMDKDKQVLLVAQKDPQVDDTVEQDLYAIGTIAEINGMRQTPAGVQMLVAGAQRARIARFTQFKPFIEVEIEIVADQVGEGLEMEAHMRSVKSLYEKYADLHSLREKIEAAGMPDTVKERALKEIDRMQSIPAASPEVGIIRTYVDWLIALPWGPPPGETWDIKVAAKVLDEDHYGVEKIKERILEYMAVRQRSQSLRSPILCFVGPPGVGKTSLGKSIARALGRKFVRLSLGGIHDEAEIRGHRRTYIGAMPGRILQQMKVAGARNPVFMLDEIDKVGADWRGDPSSALLEVLDPEQNHTFQDNYLEVPFDLSQVLFITTANVVDTIIPPLRDRMEVIRLPGYTEDEKMHIAQQFLVPRQLREHGLTEENLELPEPTLRVLIREYTHEAGVRNLEREIANIARKIPRRIAEGETEKVTVNPEDLFAYLGPSRFEFGIAELEDQVGAATGVAVNEYGGDVMTVEAVAMQGRGELALTRHIGNVMA